jgi:hypothetical protein
LARSNFGTTRETSWLASPLSPLTTAATTAIVTHVSTHHAAAATCIHRHPVNTQLTSFPRRPVRNARSWSWHVAHSPGSSYQAQGPSAGGFGRKQRFCITSPEAMC